MANAGSPFAVIARCVSTPALPGGLKSPPALKRPVSADNIPRVEVTIPFDEDTHMANKEVYPMCPRRRIRKPQSSRATEFNDECVSVVH